MGWKIFALCLGLTAARGVPASDHLDTPTAIANPSADIGDLFAWMDADGKRVNVVLDIVGKSFSDRVDYTLHIDSGPRFGTTTATLAVTCRFPTAESIECRTGEDELRGDPRSEAGLWSPNGKLHVFAGLRDDPFFNNVIGTRAAYRTAMAALDAGTKRDSTGCPHFDRQTADAILDQWRHTEGGPARNFLAGWTTSALVLSLDTGFVTQGGTVLAVWGVTATRGGAPLNRVGRPLSKNALIGLFQPDPVADAIKERWNAATPATSGEFIGEIERALALYDGFDGQCGNQIFAGKGYRKLAEILADDRIWVNAAYSRCTRFFAVERGEADCGGRTPLYDAANIWRALLVNGTESGFDDGLHRDEIEPSSRRFPFLAPPQ